MDPEDPEDVRQAAFSIRGRVQGVGFRWWTRKTAESMGLAGSVKNLRDGTVEVHVRGPAERVGRFREKLEQGPRSARVDAVRETEATMPIREGDFQIRH